MIAMEKKNREELAAAQARKEAELFAAGKSRDELEKELKRLEKRPGLFSWMRDRISSFVNFIKVAAMSIFLGRRETAKRMDAGTLEADQQAREAAAVKLAKQEVLKEKIAELDRNQNDREQTETHEAKQEQEQGQERSREQEIQELDKGRPDPEHTDGESKQQSDDMDGYWDYLVNEAEAQQFVEQDAPDMESHEPEAPAAPAQEPPKRETILAQQCREMTDSYKQGLAEYIENLTGINKDAFTVGNADGKIRIDFAPLCEQMKEKDNPYRNGVTLDVYGCTAEGKKSEFSKMLGTAVLYYTAEIYRDSKNQTQFPGTRPSDRMIAETIEKLRNRLEENERSGKPPRNFSQPLFGHILTVGRSRFGDKQQIFLSIDGGKGKTGELKDLTSWAKQDITGKIEGRSVQLQHTFYVEGQEKSYTETNRHFEGDYGNIPKYRETFHQYRDDMIHANKMPFVCTKYYDIKDLVPVFSKKLNDMLRDGTETIDKDGNKTPVLTRGFDYGDCHYHVELEKRGDELAIKGILMSQSSQDFDKETCKFSIAYGEIDGFEAKAGYNELPENIARNMADSYTAAHDLPGFDFPIPEFQQTEELVLADQPEIDQSFDRESMLEADELSL